MKTIVTSVGSFPTGSEIADAAFDLGLALARSHEIDTVELPFVEPDGVVAWARLRIGWRIDMVLTRREDAADELVEPATVRELRARAGSLDGHLEGTDWIGSAYSWREPDWDVII